MNVHSNIRRARGKRAAPRRTEGRRARPPVGTVGAPAGAKGGRKATVIDKLDVPAGAKGGRKAAVIDGLDAKAGAKRGRGRVLVDALDVPVGVKRERGRAVIDALDVPVGEKHGRGRAVIDALDVPAGAKGGRKAVVIDALDVPVGEKRGRGRPLTDDKRRRILDAALRVFAARGYEGTSVPDVAEAGGVGTGTLYHYFRDKEALVNEVYRDAKLRLRAALLDGLPDLNVYRFDEAERWFGELWSRLAAFAAAEPDAFRFLEMQDHVPYLDAKSREVELSVLAPLWLAGRTLRQQMKGAGAAGASAPVDVLIALLWGAFVGLVKASRLGYLKLDAKSLAHARDACWRMIGPMTKEG
jgi:AcrR family transcriptional regulator